ncbi:ABC transporter permease [Streptomyces sp. NPDC051018]|uniref:ABC transporter permease n=1 Tax=Streptomyces sp. NPDC051018 TaxID=3365639 RepID=UPI0037A2738F
MAATTATGARSTTAGRLTALGRAELTLLVRNRTALFVALLMPLLMVLAMKSSLDRVDLGKAGMTMAGAAVTGGIGMVLLLVVHLNLVSTYVARREELVLKRLRTGEVSDREILAGTALPGVGLALVQCLVLVAAGVTVLDLGAPERPDLLIGGIAAGVVLLTALAALTAAVTRTVESSQITTMPMFMISVAGSGLLVPLEVMPEKMAAVCELLPLSGVMMLVRAGWFGAGDNGELITAVGTALAWTVVSVFAVQRWFRWEPRR